MIGWSGPATRVVSVALLSAGVFVGGCGSGPTSPDTRTGPITVDISCTPGGARVTACTARVYCGLYGCVAGTPADATSTSTWTSDDPSVVRVVSAGVLEAVAPGNTIVRSSHPLAGEGSHAIAVFPDGAPTPTFVLAGTVYDGSDPGRPPLNGASIQVLSGVIAGRTATSGTEPPFVPGFWGPDGLIVAGSYEIFGVPSGSYRIRVSKPGYASQERDTNLTSLVRNDVVLQR